jgi:hypothetical protein
MDQQEVNDRIEIQHLMACYARGIDRRQLDLVKKCFHDDAVVNYGYFIGDTAGLMEWLKTPLMNTSNSAHLLGNSYMEFDGDVAAVETYAQPSLFLAEPAGDKRQDITVWMRYLDRFERREGRWAIAERVCVFDWGHANPDHEPFVYAAEGASGSDTHTDPSYNMMKAPQTSI